MNTTHHKYIKDLIDRLGRIQAADEWACNVNPTQWTAISYLARANRFSRSPSHVADFMSATRGTVSQTLKALARKGLIVETRSENDKRSVSYSITNAAEQLLAKQGVIEKAVSSLDDEAALSLRSGLEALVHNALLDRGLKAFGVCETCKYHQKKAQGGYCKLLEESLTAPEAKQICHEHSKAA